MVCVAREKPCREMLKQRCSKRHPFKHHTLDCRRREESDGGADGREKVPKINTTHSWQSHLRVPKRKSLSSQSLCDVPEQHSLPPSAVSDSRSQMSEAVCALRCSDLDSKRLPSGGVLASQENGNTMDLDEASAWQPMKLDVDDTWCASEVGTGGRKCKLALRTGPPLVSAPSQSHHSRSDDEFSTPVMVCPDVGPIARQRLCAERGLTRFEEQVVLDAHSWWDSPSCFDHIDPFAPKLHDTPEPSRPTRARRGG